jgi:tRNA 2-thiouridine synthesizing protein D
VIFALLLRSARHSTSRLALGFARQCLADGHDVNQVFFHGDGVYLANRLTAPLVDEPNPGQLWAAWAKESGVAMVVCSTAGLRRGVREANLAPPFQIAGTGQWLDAAQKADRIMVFGG